MLRTISSIYLKDLFFLLKENASKNFFPTFKKLQWINNFIPRKYPPTTASPLLTWTKESLRRGPLHYHLVPNTSFTDSSRGLKSVCKIKICKNFAKILHRRKFFFAHFAKFLQFFYNFFANFLQLFCNFFAISLQFFFQIFCNFFAKKEKN